jgi:hypothetical protein
MRLFLRKNSVVPMDHGRETAGFEAAEKVAHTLDIKFFALTCLNKAKADFVMTTD